jgi:autophagy-related protein 16
MQGSVATDVRSLRALLTKRNELLSSTGLATAPFSACAKLTSKVALLQRSLKIAEDQVYALKKELDLAAAAGGSGGKRGSVSEVSSSISDKKILELQEQVSALQTELNKELRGKSNDKEQILTLRDRVLELEAQVASRTRERDQCISKELELAKQTERQQDVISDIKAMLDHTTSELSEHKARLEVAEKQRDEAVLDSDQLTARLIRMQEEQAAKMQELFDMEQDLVQQKQKQERGIAASRIDTSSVRDLATSTGRAGSCSVPCRAVRKTDAHSSEVFACSPAPSGNVIASCSGDDTVKLWDPRTLISTATLGMRGGVGQSQFCVDWSSDDAMVASCGSSNAIRVFKAKDPTGLKQTLTGHTDKLYVCRFISDNKSLVSGGYDRTLRVWDVAKGSSKWTAFISSSINDLCLPHDGSAQAISGHADNVVRVWDLDHSGQCVHEITGLHSAPVTSVCSNPCNRFEMLSNSRDDTLKIVDMRTYAARATLSHSGFANGVNWNRACFSPDGHYVAAGSTDHGVCVGCSGARREMAAAVTFPVGTFGTRSMVASSRNWTATRPPSRAAHGATSTCW